jgi:hypothetical protein
MRDFAYASYADIQAHLSFIPTFSATSKPNATQVHSLLVDTSNTLDSALAVADYATPIPTAATVALELVRSWTAVGAAAKVAMAMPQGKDSKHFKALDEEWDVILKQVRDGEAGLPGVDRGSNSLARSAEGDLSLGRGASPTFTRDYIYR